MTRSPSGSTVRTAVLAAVLLALPGVARSADPDDGAYRGTGAQGVSGRETGQQATPDKGHVDPEDFVKHAAVGGAAEVKLGQLAQQKAASPDVKAFGTRMVADHGKVNDELERLAAEKEVTLPQGLDSKHQALYDRLSKLSGPQFDKAYISEMVRDHRQDVAEFQKAARSTDAQVKAFASRTLPTLEEHLREAQQIASRSDVEGAR
jgi:putative membrane protein